MSWKHEALARAVRLRTLSDIRGKLSSIGPNLTYEGVYALIDRMMTEEVSSLRTPDSGPETSKRAAMAMRPNTLRASALACYFQWHLAGLTDEEVGDILNYPRIWPRCSELRAMGLIQPTGETRVCKRTGQACEVCTITDAGRAAHAALSARKSG